MFFDASDRTIPRLSYSELEKLLTMLAAEGDTDSYLYRKLYNAHMAHLNPRPRFPRRLAI